MLKRIIYITEDHSQLNTGVTAVVNLLAGWCARCAGEAVQVTVIATGGASVAPPKKVKLIEIFVPVWARSWRWGAGFNRALRKVLAEPDCNVLHLHGVWRAAPWMAQRVATEIGVPSVLTVHGMLEPWAWHGQGCMQRLKKQLYWKFVARPVFRNVSVLHAITPLERDHLAELIPGKPIELIPNAIDLARVDQESLGHEVQPEKIVLFLGRIHPKKGIDLLIEAFIAAQIGNDWRLLIVGPDEDKAYMRRLNRIVEDHAASSTIQFIGPVYSAEKISWLTRAWIVVVPSHSEVVGMVNLEAGACGTPTITTYQTGLSDWQEGGGLLIHPNKDELAQKLREVAAWSLTERREEGYKIRAFVRERYSLESVGQKWIRLYQRLCTDTNNS